MRPIYLHYTRFSIFEGKLVSTAAAPPAIETGFTPNWASADCKHDPRDNSRQSNILEANFVYHLCVYPRQFLEIDDAGQYIRIQLISLMFRRE